MTARTSELLAKALDEVGLTTMAKLARQDIFHDFLSPHATPVLELATLLQGAVAGCPDKARAERIRQLGRRVINGEFDAEFGRERRLGQERRGTGDVQQTGERRMRREDWFRLPLKLRQRWWRETDYGLKPPSEELTEIINEETNSWGRPNPDGIQGSDGSNS